MDHGTPRRRSALSAPADGEGRPDGCPVMHAHAKVAVRGAMPDRAASVASAASACPAQSGWMPKDLRRWTLAGIGVLATTLGIIGAILPGLPTTIFVIIAAWCFARSCPVLEQKLLRNRLFAPSMQIIDGTRPFTPAARATTVGFMASGGAVSTGFLAWTGTLSTPILWSIVASVLIGAVAIALYRPTPRAGG